MSQEPETIFLARETYRRRRMMDAGRMLPVFGVILFFAPALWIGEFSTFAGLVYLLLGWVLLIVLAAMLSSRLPIGGSDSDVDRLSGDDGGR